MNKLVTKGQSMQAWLQIADLIDRVSIWLGRLATWCVFIACMVSAINAGIRYTFDSSSNAWLEMQWYLFAVTVMFGAGWVLKLNEHVRVDVIYGGRAPRTKALIDLAGLIIFLMPMCLLMVWMSWPWALDSWATQEVSSNAGGLIRWPVKLMIPLGFAFLALQGVAEIIRRIAYLAGLHDMDITYERPLQ